MQADWSIAGVRVRLRSDHAEFWRCAERRYANFFVAADGEVDDTIEHRVADEVDIPHSERAWTSVDLRRSNGFLTMIRGNVMGTWDLAGRLCRTIQHQCDFDRPVPAPEYGADSILRVMLSFRLLERGGLLVHAAGLVRDGRGYLFLGQSGAGKSTLTRASAASCTVLSDDLTLVALTSSGAEVWGTPFFGDFAAAGVNKSAPLVGMYLLRQAPFNQVTPIAPRAALAKVLGSALLFGGEGRWRQKALDLASELCSRVPAYRLDFLPDDSFWSCIDA